MQLPVIDPKVPFQPEFQPVVNDLITFLKSGLGSNLHSVYIYGSVARKTAQPGHSNLDVVVV
ncbi:nucleotidyltransferase domain-containing protein, partial [Vibrio fortis]